MGDDSMMTRFEEQTERLRKFAEEAEREDGKYKGIVSIHASAILALIYEIDRLKNENELYKNEWKVRVRSR